MSDIKEIEKKHCGRRQINYGVIGLSERTLRELCTEVTEIETN